MSEKIKLFGGKSTEAEKIKAANLLEEERKKARQPVEGEPEKIKEAMQLIDTINDLLREEVMSLGIKDYEPISYDQIHLLPDAVFKKSIQELTWHVICQTKTLFM
jgi:hypothetical protein